jgi:hypothetical protein
MKNVRVIGYEFDSLPGHVRITARGSGSGLREAVCRAVRGMLGDRRLHRKRVKTFKLSVAVVKEADAET